MTRRDPGPPKERPKQRTVPSRVTAFRGSLRWAPSAPNSLGRSRSGGLRHGRGDAQQVWATDPEIDNDLNQSFRAAQNKGPSNVEAIRHLRSNIKEIYSPALKRMKPRRGTRGLIRGRSSNLKKRNACINAVDARQ